MSDQVPLPPEEGSTPEVPVTCPADGPASMPFRRLDARMLLVHPIQEAIRFLPALFGLFLTGRGGNRSHWWDVAALVVIVVWGMSRWFTTRYRISGGQIELRTGLIFRKVIATPADRVRTVDVTAPIWHRLLGLARVDIGTGSSRLSDDRIQLDALAEPVARALRAELLHRRGLDRADGAGVPSDPLVDAATGGDLRTDGDGRSTPEPAEQVLVTFDPRWIVYAPLTTSGLLTALTIWGFAAQYLGNVVPQIEAAVGQLAAWGAVVSAVVLLGVGLLAIASLAITAYILSFWGFRLTRHRGGTLQVTRGLLTTRSTSLEEARIRGIELGEPLGLRWAKASRLHAVGTGLRSGDGMESGRAWLVPPASRRVVLDVARRVLGDPAGLDVPLVPHGPAARRRRYVRAIVPAVLLAGLVTLAWWLGRLPGAVTVAAYLPLLVAPALAHDRYAALGHALTPTHVIARSGSVERRRDIIERAGVVGVVTRATFFQRRAGVRTVVVATAAGRQGYPILDVPVELTDDLVVTLVPEASAFRDV